MTARWVDGVPVIATEPVPSNWRNKATGQPLQYRQIVKLLLEDGREVYGCVHCDYASPKLTSLRPHMNKHRLPKFESRDGAGIDLGEFLRRVDSYERLEADRDHWRRRALEAEGHLRRLREALGVRP